MDLKNTSRTLKGAVIVSVLAAFCLTAMASPLLHYLTTKPLRETLLGPVASDFTLVGSTIASAIGCALLVFAGVITWRLFTRIGKGQIFEQASTHLLLTAAIIYLLSTIAWAIDFLIWFPSFDLVPYSALSAAALAAMSAALFAIAFALAKLNQQACALDDELKMVV